MVRFLNLITAGAEVGGSVDVPDYVTLERIDFAWCHAL
jgi:hypothetical protein